MSAQQALVDAVARAVAAGATGRVAVFAAVTDAVDAGLLPAVTVLLGTASSAVDTALEQAHAQGLIDWDRSPNGRRIDGTFRACS